MTATRQVRSRGVRGWWEGLGLGLQLAVLLAVLPAGCGTPPAAAGEAERIAEVMGLKPGMHVADVGAGDGEWTLGLVRAVGSAGKVYATEVKEEVLAKLRSNLAEFPQATVLSGDQEHTGLPPACCDAILLRQVYHHFTDPAAMRADLHRALRPGGLLVIIDITPQKSWPELPGVPERGGHGITPDDLIAELTGDGWTTVATYLDWSDEDDHFCVVFRAAE